MKTVTGQNPLPPKSLAKSKDTPKGYFKSIAPFAEIVLSHEATQNNPRGVTGVERLNGNALALLTVYHEFIAATKGSTELLTKVKHEMDKLTKHLANTAAKSSKRKLPPVFDDSVENRSENVPFLCAHEDRSTVADSDLVFLDHCYFSKSLLPFVDGNGVEEIPVGFDEVAEIVSLWFLFFRYQIHF